MDNIVILNRFVKLVLFFVVSVPSFSQELTSSQIVSVEYIDQDINNSNTFVVKLNFDVPMDYLSSVTPIGLTNAKAITASFRDRPYDKSNMTYKMVQTDEDVSLYILFKGLDKGAASKINIKGTFNATIERFNKRAFNTPMSELRQDGSYRMGGYNWLVASHGEKNIKLSAKTPSAYEPKFYFEKETGVLYEPSKARQTSNRTYEAGRMMSEVTVTASFKDDLSQIKHWGIQLPSTTRERIRVPMDIEVYTPI